MRTVPSERCSAGHAMGSTVAIVADSTPSGAWPSANRTATVAAGRISRIATHSVSCGSPSKGRFT